MENLLCSYQVPEDIIRNFTSNGITMEIFYNLSPELLKELCPHIGTRIRLSEIITANAATESNKSTETEVSPDCEPSTSREQLSESEPPQNNVNVFVTRCFPDFDLKTLLSTSVWGNSILKFYETNNCLSNTKRNQLTDIIIKYYYTYIGNRKVSYEEYNFIAAKIISLFPKECIGTYFTKPVAKRQSINGRPVAARGKLVDKVRNLIYKYRERKRSLPLEDDELTKRTTRLKNQDTIWLKTNRDPWDEVIVRRKFVTQFYDL